MNRKRWAVAAALVSIILSAGSARAAGIPWRTDLETARGEAAKADRLVMIEFFDTDCSWCQRMDAETLANESVVKATEGVVPVRVDVNEHPDLARQHAIQGVPAFVFVEGTGDEAARVEGFMPADPFVERLNEVLTEHQKAVTLRAQIAREPENSTAKAELARIYVERRLGDRAAPLVDALAALPKEKAPKDMADLLLGTAVAYGSRGNNDRALVYLARVTRDYPGTEQAEWAGFFTGLALGLKGERDAAIAQLGKVVESAKSDDIKERARVLQERFREAPPVPTL